MLAIGCGTKQNYTPLKEWTVLWPTFEPGISRIRTGIASH